MLALLQPLVGPLIGPIFAQLFKQLFDRLFDWIDTRQARADNMALGRTEAAAQSNAAAREKEREYAEIAARPVTHDELLERLRTDTF